MINTIIGIGLVILAVLLFLVKNDAAIKKIATVMAVVSAVAALLVWFFPTHPVPPSLTYISNENWEPYQNHSPGSFVTSLKPIVGTDRSFEVSLELLTDGWVSIFKKLPSQSLSGTSGIKFYYSGTGVPNTLELKLIDRNETIFEAVWSGATATPNGADAYWEVKYSSMKCRPNSGKCKTTGDVSTLTLNPKNIDRIDFSFSNRPTTGDIPGKGTIIMKEILIIP